MVSLYMDDLLLAAKTKSKTSWMKHVLSKRFDMKDLGEAKVILGPEIAQNRKERKLWLTQQSYMNKIAARFEISDSKQVATPMEEPKSSSDRLEVISDGDESAVGVPFFEATGSLMYLMIGS